MRYRDKAHACFVAELVHLPFFFPVQKIVLVLHRDKFGPAVLLRRKLHRCELVGPHRGCAQIPDFAALHQVVECFHRLFDGYAGIESVDLEEVKVVGP